MYVGNPKQSKYRFKKWFVDLGTFLWVVSLGFGALKNFLGVEAEPDMAMGVLLLLILFGGIEKRPVTFPREENDRARKSRG